MVSGKSSFFLLVTTTLSTLSLFFPAHPFLLVLWVLFLLLGIVGIIVEGSVRKGLSRSISFSFLVVGLLFMVENRWRSTIASEDWSSLYPEIVEDLREEINDHMRSHLEGRLRLVEGLGEEIEELYSGNDEGDQLRERVFELLEKRRGGQPDSEDLLFVLVGLDGMDIAWSGDSYFPRVEGSSSDFSADSMAVKLFRGNIFTAAVITRHVPEIGTLVLYDHLEIRHHLSKRYARSGRLIDRLGQIVGTAVSLYPVNYQGSFEGRGGSVLFPFIFKGEHLGDWSVDPVAREGYVAKLISSEYRFLPLLLFLPWIVSLFLVKDWLRCSLLRAESPSWVRRLLYIVLLGASFFVLRVALLKASFPSSWIGGPYFSPRFFATGLLERGSLSIGEFFISGLFIALFLIHVSPLLTARKDQVNMSRRERVVWISGGLALGLSFSMSSPFVLERLFRDSLFSMVIDQAFIGSSVTLFWELSFFLFLLSLFLVVALCLRPAISLAGRGLSPLLICGLLSGILFSVEIYMALFAYGSGWNMVFGVAEGGIILFGGGLISAIVLRKEKGGNNQPTGWINVSVIVLLSLLSAGVIYPALLRYRHLALEETGKDLIEKIEAPYDNWATFVLEEVADDLLDRKEEVFSGERERRGLGFFVWANSRLSTLGQRTALVIYDGTGREISGFSLTDVEPDRALSDFFLSRAQEIDYPFIYHGFSRGNEFYTAVVPYWSEGRLKSFLTVTLPTDLEERLGGGPIKLFTEEAEEVQLNVPSPMELRVYSAEEGEDTDGGAWKSSRDENGGFRYFRKRMEVGGLEQVVEVGFHLQGVGESISRVNFLFILHFLLMCVLWGISSAGYRGVLLREKLLSGTFRRKLTLTLIIFSVIPTLLFGVIGAREIRNRLDLETRSRAKDGLEAMIHLVKRDLEKARGSEGSEEVLFHSNGDGIYARNGGGLVESEEGISLDNVYVKEIARTIGRDFLLFCDNRLESTSQEDLAQAGMVPQMVGEKSYVDLVLKGKEYAFHRQSLGNYQYLVANKRLSPVGAEHPIILATPLLWRQQEIDQEVASLTYLVLMVIIMMLSD